MRFSYLLFVAAVAFLVNSDAVCATQSTVASVETATELNSIDAGKSKRFLRSHKWVHDDTNTDSEERGNIQKTFFQSWLNAGKTPGQANLLIKQFTISDARKAKLHTLYAKKYRATYSTFKEP
ncbi:RxLR effector protein [Phytophthora megakarya]|uniref:RxLR effector protein n=1 Tax=Phytophthora megakarya TaxID=4795 RepID=A0A225VPC1_9STRA|nr:RxLR effector protein [Phytophthora megakarya]